LPGINALAYLFVVSCVIKEKSLKRLAPGRRLLRFRNRRRMRSTTTSAAGSSAGFRPSTSTLPTPTLSAETRETSPMKLTSPAAAFEPCWSTAKTLASTMTTRWAGPFANVVKLLLLLSLTLRQNKLECLSLESIFGQA